MSSRLHAVVLAAALLIPHHAVRAADDLCARFDCGRDFTLIMPEQVSGSGVSSTLGGAHAEPFSYSCRIERTTGLVHFTMKSASLEMRSILDRSLRLMKNDKTFRGAMAVEVRRHLGWDRREMRYVPANGSMAITYFREGERIRSTGVDCRPAVIDCEHLMINLQALLLAGFANDFRSDIIAGAKGWRLGAKMRLVRAARIEDLQSGYVFPPAMLAAAERWGDLLVYEIGMSGIIGVFYRARFYVVFSARPPFRWLAYWGGPRKLEEFVFVDR